MQIKALTTSLLYGAIALMTSFVVSCAPPRQGVQGSAAPEPVASPTQPQTSLPAPRALGTVDGGGGNVVVCRNPVTKAVTVELLDLYEAQHVYGRTLEPTKAKTVHVSYAAFALKFSRRLTSKADELDAKSAWNIENIHYEEIKSKTDIIPYRRRFGPVTQRLQDLDDSFSFEENFNSRAKYLSGSTKLKRIDDSHEIVTDSDCQTVQIINYQPDQTIVVQKRLWDQLNITNRAALMAHEYLYKRYRDLGAKTSVEARKIVGILFSTQKVLPVIDESSLPKLNCISDPISDKLGDSRQIGMSISIPKTAFEKPEIRLLDYADQILIAPTKSDWDGDRENNGLFFGSANQTSLMDCKEHERDKKWAGFDVSGPASGLNFTSPYFNDTYSVSYGIRCGTKVRKTNPSGFEMKLKLTRASDQKVILFTCDDLSTLPSNFLTN